MNTSHRLFTVNKVLVASVPWIVLVVTGVAAQEKRDEFYYLSEMNKASSVMVVEQGIVPRRWAGPLPRRFPRSLPMRRGPAPKGPATI